MQVNKCLEPLSQLSVQWGYPSLELLGINYFALKKKIISQRLTSECSKYACWEEDVVVPNKMATFLCNLSCVIELESSGSKAIF
jgi:hypothetical protein